MQNKKAVWSAVIIGAILIAIIVYALYKGQANPVQDGMDPTQNDGIEYIPPDVQQDLDHNEI